MSWAALYCIWTMRQTLLKSNRELRRQSEEQKRLKAAFPYDLRNPITVLKGSIETAKNHAISGTEKNEAVSCPVSFIYLNSFLKKAKIVWKVLTNQPKNPV